MRNKRSASTPAAGQTAEALIEARVPGSKSRANSEAKTPAPPAGLSEIDG